VSGSFRSRVLIGAAVAAGLLAACGKEAATTAALPSPSPTAAPSPAVVVATKVLPKLGRVLVDERGFTLYLMTTEKGGAIACTGTCAGNWPPLVLPSGASAATAGAGARGSLLGTATLPDGSLQVTYNEWPLHTFSGDRAPGDANGQGVRGIWFAVTAKGAAAIASPSPSPKPATRTTTRSSPTPTRAATSSPKASPRPSPSPKPSPKPSPSPSPTYSPPY
jgi:predicted lipoprotein with Yx(FWY)xxD motif